MELLILKSQLATMREKKEYYRQELLKALERPHHSRRMNKGKRTFAMPLDDEVEILEADPRGKAPANSGYDPHHPHYDLNGYIPRESQSDHDESNHIKESIADNFNTNKTAGDANTAGPS
jgi:flagellar basal body rod protein FlgC